MGDSPLVDSPTHSEELQLGSLGPKRWAGNAIQTGGQTKPYSDAWTKRERPAEVQEQSFHGDDDDLGAEGRANLQNSIIQKRYRNDTTERQKYKTSTQSVQHQCISFALSPLPPPLSASPHHTSITVSIMLQITNVAHPRATPPAELHPVAFILRHLERPVPAADAAVRVHTGQLVAGVRVVDVQLLGAPADVIERQGATGAVPFLVVFEGEAGVGAAEDGQEAADGGCEGGVPHDFNRLLFSIFFSFDFIGVFGKYIYICRFGFGGNDVWSELFP